MQVLPVSFLCLHSDKNKVEWTREVHFHGVANQQSTDDEETTCSLDKDAWLYLKLYSAAF